jgi:hypothetical protein
MVSVLAVFNVNKARDGRGREVDVVPEYTPGVIMWVCDVLGGSDSTDDCFDSHPKPYPFCITPRSPHATQLIQQTEVDH